MASIATPLLQRRKEPADEEQLLKLFWNRAELKKELAKLRREKDGLAEQLRQQESTNLRTQQRLEQIERLLADPLQAVNAMIYYQLRGMWHQSHKRLNRVARELASRQRDREHQHVQSRFEQVRGGEMEVIDDKLAALDGRARVVEADLALVQERARQLRGFWNHFRRRRLVEQGEAIRAALEGLQAQADRLRAARREKELEPAPEFAGLSLEGKRNINLALIATAQQLLVQFADHSVAELARDAAVRSLGDVSYGSAAECQALGQNIAAVLRQLDNAEDLNAQTRRRAEFLKTIAHYRRDTDTVPAASSFASIPVTITAAGEPQAAPGPAMPINVLADEYWDIYAVLLT